jgi:hypothetical protein
LPVFRILGGSADRQPNIKSMEELKGKRIGVFVSDRLICVCLRPSRYGLSEQDVICFGDSNA